MYDHVPRRVRFEDLCAVLAEGRPIYDVLPGDVAAALRDAPGPLCLTDFAGRDSVAAAMAWLGSHEVATLLPVGDVVPTRYGDWRVYDDNWQRMHDEVRRRYPDVRFVPWFVVEDVDTWRLLNGRYLNEIIRAFGFFSPCLGCHLHFYALRAVLANALGADVLISGEKELHGKKRKANQTVEAVDAYRSFSRPHGVQHHFPIHDVTGEDQMQRLLGDGWQEGERQLSCVMSGNDQGLDGKPLLTPDQIRSYMQDFAVPLATRIVELRRQRIRGRELEQRIDSEARALLAVRSA